MRVLGKVHSAGVLGMIILMMLLGRILILGLLGMGKGTEENGLEGDGGDTKTSVDAAKALPWGHPEHITWESAVMVMEEGVVTGDNLCGMSRRERQLSWLIWEEQYQLAWKEQLSQLVCGEQRSQLFWGEQLSRLVWVARLSQLVWGEQLSRLVWKGQLVVGQGDEQL